MTTHDELQKIAEFDHPFLVLEGERVVDGLHDVFAPEVYHVEGEQHPKDVEVLDEGWDTFSVGYTGQWSYNGAVMHASEYIGGRLAEDILTTPGVYVVTSVEVLPEDDDPEPEPAGWIVLRRKPSDDRPHTAYFGFDQRDVLYRATVQGTPVPEEVVAEWASLFPETIYFTMEVS